MTEFDTYLRSRNIPPDSRTWKTYQQRFQLWNDFQKQNILMAEESHVLAFAEHLSKPRNVRGNQKVLDIRTRHGVLTLLAAFYHWLVLQGTLRSSPFYHVRIPKPEAQTVPRTVLPTLEEIRVLLETARSHPRDYCILLLLVTSRFLVLDITRLTWGSFFMDDAGRIGAELVSRGNKKVIRSLSPKVWNELIAYRLVLGLPADIQPGEENKPVFLNRFGNALQEIGIIKRFECLRLEAGIEKHLTPLSLSHAHVVIGYDNQATMTDLMRQTQFSSTIHLRKYGIDVPDLQGTADLVTRVLLAEQDS